MLVKSNFILFPFVCLLMLLLKGQSGRSCCICGNFSKTKKLSVLPQCHYSMQPLNLQVHHCQASVNVVGSRLVKVNNYICGNFSKSKKLSALPRCHQMYQKFSQRLHFQVLNRYVWFFYQMWMRTSSQLLPRSPVCVKLHLASFYSSVNIVIERKERELITCLQQFFQFQKIVSLTIASLLLLFV